MKNIKSKIQSIEKEWSIFPNTNKIASYAPLSQSISFEQIKSEEFEKIIDFNNIEDNSEKLKYFELYKTVIHEIRHWMDQLSTLWGQKNLVDIYNALETRINIDENEFWRISQLFNDIKKEKYLEFYTELVENVDYYKRPWISNISCGMRYSPQGRLSKDNPILFTRFFNSEKQYLCRIPLSIGSLLEVNAVAEELKVDLDYYNTLSDNAKNIGIKMKIIPKYVDNYIYNPYNLIYSVAAHFLANTSNQSDIYTVYLKSSQIATLCLNIPDNLFNDLRIPKCFEPFGEKNLYFKSSKDRGYLYSCLLLNAQEDNIQLNQIDIDSILKASNLPPVSEIYKMSFEQIGELKNDIIGSKLKKRLESLLDIGTEYFEKRGIDGLGSDITKSIKQKNNLPQIIFSNTKIKDVDINIFDDNLKINELDDWLNFVWFALYKMDEFIKACSV